MPGPVAGSLAWWLAVHWQNTSMPFLAPWTALPTVHATAYRSVTSGLEMTLAPIIGVIVFFLIGHFLGVSGNPVLRCAFRASAAGARVSV